MLGKGMKKLGKKNDEPPSNLEGRVYGGVKKG